MASRSATVPSLPLVLYLATCDAGMNVELMLIDPILNHPKRIANLVIFGLLKRTIIMCAYELFISI